MPDSRTKDLLKLQGRVERVDLINREVELTAQWAKHVVLVPADCEVLLHGERVKLRMLQPGDRVQIDCRMEDETLIAHRLEA